MSNEHEITENEIVRALHCLNAKDRHNHRYYRGILGDFEIYTMFANARDITCLMNDLYSNYIKTQIIKSMQTLTMAGPQNTAATMQAADVAHVLRDTYAECGKMQDMRKRCSNWQAACHGATVVQKRDIYGK